MMKTREYDVEDEAFILSMSEDDYIGYLEEKIEKKDGVSISDIYSLLNHTYIKGDDKCMVIYYVDEKQGSFKQHDSHDFLRRVTRENATSAICISNKQFSVTIEKNMRETFPKIHFFNINEFLLNILKFSLNPRFKLLTLKESVEFLRRNNITTDKLPAILDIDPIVKYYGAEIGQIFEINNSSIVVELYAPRYKTYRVVTPNIDPRKK